ncbi:MAG: hypothetical protein AAB388_03915 [Patescibacteria group bacterium]
MSRRIVSKQRNVRFVYCPHPINIDMSCVWGDNGDSFQRAPNGSFLKLTEDGLTVQHLVQARPDKSAPIGWEHGDHPGLYNKLPIWIEGTIIQSGVLEVPTLDGLISLTVTEPSMICYNDRDGAPESRDVWVQTIANLVKNYDY